MSEESLDTFLSGLNTRLVDVAVQASAGPIIKVDEGLKHATTPAPNAIEWAVGTQFLGVDTLYTHVRQYQVIRDLFQLRCPLPSCNNQSEEAIDCWGKGREYLQSENLLVYNDTYKMDVCPCCGNTRADLEQDGLLDYYNQMHLVVGMRGGKTSVAAVIGTYIEHMMVILGHKSNGLDKYYHQLPGQKFDITFIASTEVQSKDTIWAKFTELRRNSAWYNRYIQWIKQKEIEQKVPNGVKPLVYRELDQRIENDFIGLNLVSMNSNCFVGDTKVLMSDYKYKQIADVSIGDCVIDKHGVEQIVEDKWTEEAPGELVEVSTYFGRKFKCTKNHKFPIWAWPRVCSCGCGAHVSPGRCFVSGHQNRLSNVDRQMRYIDGSGGHIRRVPVGYNPRIDSAAADIRPGDFLLIPRKFEEIVSNTTLSHARMLGYYVSEGWSNVRNGSIYGVNFGLNINEDKTVAADIRSICDINNIHHNTVYLPDRNSLTIYTSNSEAIDFAKFAILNGGEKATSKILSQDVMRWPIQYKIELLRGMFRGDGTHYTGRNRNSPSISYTTASECLAKQLQILLAHVGIYAGYVHHRRAIGKFNKCPADKYMINIGGEQAERFAKLIWGNSNKLTLFKRSKKVRAKCLIDDDYIYVPVKSVNMIPNSEPVYNLTVSNDHSYIVDGIGTYNSGGLAGRTRVAGFIDELARFEVTDSAHGADEVYRVLDNSLSTVRGAVNKYSLPKWLGLMAAISSPISIEDKSMTLLKQCPSIDHMYYGHYATWDFNPEQPRELFEPVFQRDPIGAMRDYGARPPSAASPLIIDPDLFKQLAVQQDLTPTATFRQILQVDRIGREYISAIVDSAKLCSDGSRFICYDAGASFDQFAGACAHGEFVDTPDGKVLVTVYDWVFRLLPEIKPRRDVWFDSILRMVEHLNKYYVISKIEFDRWQSTQLIQQIRDRGIVCEMSGTTYEHFSRLVNDVNFSRVRMLPPMPGDDKVDPPLMSPQGLAFYELERLERDSALKKVYNPLKGRRRGWNSDDVATVIAHVNHMVQSSVIDLDDSTSRKARLHREQSGGTGWSSRGTLFRPVTSKRGW